MNNGTNFIETPLEANNKFTLDFSNTELIYQINFSTKNDYYITTINCNLVISNGYGDLIDDIKELSTKSRLLLEKGPAYQFDLSFLRLAFYYHVRNEKQMNCIFCYIKRTLIFIAGNINFTTSNIIK